MNPSARSPRPHRSPHRLIVASTIALALAASACGGTDDSPAVGVDPAESMTAATASETSAPATSEAPAAAETPATSAPVIPTVLLPEVLCVDASEGDVAFAVVNEGSVPVAVDAGASTFKNIVPSSFGLEPLLFAPGRTSPVYWAQPEGDGPVVWTVTGPDGVARTAANDDATPACTPELVAPTTSDSRAPSLEIGEPVLNADGNGVGFASEVSGVPDSSVCAEGLEPRPVRIVTDDGAGGMATEGPVAEWNVELFPNLDGSPGRFGRQLVAALVVDQCAGADVVQAVWPGGAFEEIYDGVLVCISEGADGSVTLTTDDDDPECRSGLPGTGGTRSRPG